MPTKTPKAVAKTKLLTPEERRDITDLWEVGEVTIENLCARMGRSSSAIRKFIKDAGIVRGCKKPNAADAVRAAVEQADLADMAVKATRVKETQEENYTLSRTIQKLISLEMRRCHDEKLSQAKGFDSYRSMLVAAQALATSQKIRERALGMDKEGDPADKPLPTLGIHVVSDEQIMEIQQANKVTNPMDEVAAAIDAEMTRIKK
jgi:transposase-like protein